MTEPKTELSGDEQGILNQLLALDTPSCGNAAEYAREQYIAVHRGVFPGSNSVIFGNDCFNTDVRSRLEVCKLVENLNDDGIDILGFGTDADGVTWAMEVASDDPEWLQGMLWGAWTSACDEVCGDAAAENATT
jgi:hypothetical protein